MMTAVNYLTVFQGAKRSGNTLAVLPKRATQENQSNWYSPKGCGDNGAGGCVGFVLCLPGRCYASVTAYRNSLNAIKSALPKWEFLCPLAANDYSDSLPCDAVFSSFSPCSSFYPCAVGPGSGPRILPLNPGCLIVSCILIQNTRAPISKKSSMLAVGLRAGVLKRAKDGRDTRRRPSRQSRRRDGPHRACFPGRCAR